jgi:hypothetical protein
MMAWPFSEVGACEAFICKVNPGVVPAVMLYVPEHCQNHVLAVFGNVQVQITAVVPDKVTAEVGAQVFTVPLTSVFIFKYGVVPGVVISGREPPIAMLGPSVAAVAGVADCV